MSASEPEELRRPTRGPIIVGVDGSPHADRALGWAIDQAVLDGRDLVLVHALAPTTPALLEPGPSSAAESHALSLRNRGRDLLAGAAEVVAARAPRLARSTHFRLADPRTTLIDLSAAAHLVVVGSRGRGPVRSLLLGSTSVALTRHARCPVVVHRPGSGVPGRGVVVGVDGTASSAAVLALAFAHAESRRLPLTILHSVDLGAPAASGYLMPGAPLEEHRMPVSRSVAGLAERHPDVVVRSLLARGAPGTALIDHATNAALLVVGRHARRFGSVASWLVEHAVCPVAVVPLGTAAHHAQEDR